MLRNFILTLFIFSQIILLTSCSLINRNFEKKPIDLRILTTKNLNPDETYTSSPLQLDIYQIDDINRFTMLNYPYFSKLFIFPNNANEPNEKNDLLELKKPKYSWIIQPDSFFANDIDFDENQEYIGVIAHYQDLVNSDWKYVFKKQENKKHKNYFLYLYVNNNSISQISKDEMDKLLKQYAKTHPEDIRFTRKGKLKPQQPDYSKGIFIQNFFENKNLRMKSDSLKNSEEN